MKAYELLANPKAWTQGSFARNQDGITVDINSSEACSWCMVGAIRKCYPEYRERVEIFSRIYDIIHACYATSYNDNSTHADILETLKRAEDASN